MAAPAQVSPAEAARHGHALAVGHRGPGKGLGCMHCSAGMVAGTHHPGSCMWHRCPSLLGGEGGHRNCL